MELLLLGRVQMGYVTRYMASDAGDTNLEGQSVFG